MVDSPGVEVHLLRGNQLKAAGQLEAAIACYQKALVMDPELAEVHYRLCEVYFARGQLVEAIAHCQQTLKLDPLSALAYKTLGNALQAQGKVEEAQRAYSQAVEIQPEWAAAHANLGSTFYRLGLLDEAISCYQRAIALQPNLAGVYWNLGNVYEDRGELTQAVDSWRQALVLQPQMAGSERFVKIGNALLKLESLNEAVESYKQAISLQPDCTEALSNLGVTRVKQGQFNEGISYLETALRLHPHLAGLHCNLGIALFERAKQNKESSAEEFQAILNALLKAIALQPDLVEAHQGLFHAIATPQPNLGNFSLFREAVDLYLAACKPPFKILANLSYISTYFHSSLHHLAQDKLLEVEQHLSNGLDEFSQNFIDILYFKLLFSLPYLRDNLSKNAYLYRLLGLEFSRSISSHGKLSNPVKQNRMLKHERSEKLRIGFLSPHFRRHSVAWCSLDIIRELSRISPNIYLYVTQPQQADDKTLEFKKIAAKFYTPKKESQEFLPQIIEQIINDEIDILIDLDSLTTPINLQILDAQPAPVCLSWLGFDAPFICSRNYFFCDRHTHPAGVEENYREQLVRMPDSFVAVSGFECNPLNRENFRVGLRISSEQVVYLCVAPGKKLNCDLVNAQIQILNQVPDSVLLHKGQGDSAVIRNVYEQACSQFGVSFHRVKFLGRTETEEDHRGIYTIADVLLDSYPYNGGTHTLEALWFNLPIVTRTGEQFLARMGYSFLSSLGIDAGVAWSWAEYITWGVRLGKDVSLRQAIREKLVQSKQSKDLAPLWNPKKFARDMYAVFEELKSSKGSEDL